MIVRTSLACAAALALAIPASAQQDRPGQTSPAQSTQTRPGQTTQPRPGQTTKGQQDPAGQQPANRNSEANQAQAQDGQNAPMDDALFTAAAAASGMNEVAVSRMASQRASDDQIKQFAQQMIEDHTKANQELMQLASSKQLNLPRQPDPRAQAELIALAGSGAEFDKCYAKQQLAAHICAVALFEAQAQRGQDPEVKAWAAKQLPALREHLDHAKQLCDSMGGLSGSASRDENTQRTGGEFAEPATRRPGSNPPETKQQESTRPGSSQPGSKNPGTNAPGSTIPRGR